MCPSSRCPTAGCAAITCKISSAAPQPPHHERVTIAHPIERIELERKNRIVSADASIPMGMERTIRHKSQHLQACTAWYMPGGEATPAPAAATECEGMQSPRSGPAEAAAEQDLLERARVRQRVVHPHLLEPAHTEVAHVVLRH